MRSPDVLPIAVATDPVSSIGCHSMGLVLQCAIGSTILPALFSYPGEVRLLIRSKQVRAVFKWQCLATVVMALLAWPLFGAPGAVSAVVGGLINLVAGGVYFAVASVGQLRSAGQVIQRAFRAEASKVLIIIIALWFAMTHYKGIVHVPFFAVFVLTALLPAVAFLVPDDALTAESATDATGSSNPNARS